MPSENCRRWGAQPSWYLAGLLLSGLPLAPVAAGEGDFLSPFAGVAMAYDDNLFRLADDVDENVVLGESSRADWSRTSFAGIGLDWLPGRQHISASAQALDQTFQRFSFLDNTGYDSKASWTMAAGDRLTGALDIGFNRQLGSFDNFRAAVNDPIDTQYGDLKIGYLVTPEIELLAGAGRRASKHGLASREASNSRGSHWLLGASRGTPLGNRIGFEFRHENGSNPNRDFTPLSLVDNGYQQDEGVATFTWQGGFTSVDGRLGYAWRKFDHLDYRNFSGPSGSLDARYAWSAKLLLDVNVYRRLESLDDLFSSSISATGLSVKSSWAPTDRIVVQGTAGYEDRQFEDSGLFVGATQPKESLQSYGLNASYTPRPLVTLGAGYTHSQRSSDRPGFQYSDNTFNFSLQVNL